MGICCSCCDDGESQISSETEMQNRGSSSSQNRKALSIARALTAPSIDVEDDTKVRIRVHP
jgi:hypothetical protein